MTAASQSIRLHRMSCREDANASIRSLLCSRQRAKNGELLPRQAQVYLWQSAVLYLMISVFIMIAGMLTLVWTAAGGENRWNGQLQLALMFTIVAVIVMALFLWEHLTLFSWDGERENAEESVRL